MSEKGQVPDAEGEDLSPYAGRWIARLGKRVIGQGGSPEQALRAALASRHKETPQVMYVPAEYRLAFPEILETIATAMPVGVTIYLVGGAVRDALLGQVSHDLDFVLSGEVLPLARRLADRIGAAFYPLDEQRDTGRLVLVHPDGSRQVLDFARMQGSDLESDLRKRDFTVNAMAVDIRQPQALLDPLGGAADLREKKLRACSVSTFTDDPVRILRAIRQAAAYQLRILPETRHMMQQSVPLLSNISSERLRDELFRILDGPQPSACLRALDLLNTLPYILPELPILKGIAQSPPHVQDAWNHTLDVLKKLEAVLRALSPEYDPDTAASLFLRLAVLRLGRYRQQIGEHLRTQLNPERSPRALLFLAALYHDVAKPQTRSEDESGRIRFLGHDQEGARLVEARARALCLSNVEVARLKKIVGHHMRPILLSQSGRQPTRRAIYRFFRDSGPAGVDICLLSLADILATQGAALQAEFWVNHLDVVRTLLEAWWEKPEECVSPPVLLNGSDLIKEYHLQPGPLVGRLLEAIREAQAAGQVTTREQALDLAGDLLDRNGAE